MSLILNRVRETIRDAISLLEGSSLNEFESRLLSIASNKNAQPFMEYQHPERAFTREPSADHIFPLDTVILNNYKNEYKADIEHAIVHTGPYANELALRMNAFALVMGNDIYFRNGAYKPESEEGRKILAHELTHISQYEDRRITPNTDKAVLEKEAELAEGKAEHDPDPYEPYPVGNKLYYLRKSQVERVTMMAADGVEQWICEQKIIRDEKDYFKLLYAYNEWLNENW